MPYKLPKLRAQLDDHKPASDESALECRDPSLTQQSFLEDTDINTMVGRFLKTGELPQVIQLPKEGDFTNVLTFQDAMNRITDARNAFMALPAQLRARFENDPQKYHDFVLDPANKDECIKLGLMKKPEEPAPEVIQKVKIVEDNSPTPPTPDRPKKA